MTDTQITEELLLNIHLRAREYAIAKCGRLPDTLELQESGVILATYLDYHGDYIGSEEIYAENLTEDLDLVAAQRSAQIEEDRRKREIYEAAQKELRDRQAKEERRIQYNKLKKEFE